MTQQIYNDVVTKLQHYMLDENNIRKSQIQLGVNKEPPKPLVNNIIKYSNKHQLFCPREKDSLFWCLYVMKHGDASYEMLKHRNFITEKKLKFESIEQIRKNKEIIKMYKFATLTHLENNLANDERLDVKTFLSLCVIENINVIYINKKTYFKLSMNDTNTIHVIHSLDNYKFGHEQKMISDDIINNLYPLESIDKPIKAISAYKVQELVDICNQLSIETTCKESGKTKPKKDLYESLIQYF
jgi:hypothetical protein